MPPSWSGIGSVNVAYGNGGSAKRRRFALLGVYGQSIFADPELKLVIVQTAANATAEAGQNSLGADRQAFWKGVVGFYGKW
jgi:CubicO group peptidase (beta-lactamase class C family)